MDVSQYLIFVVITATFLASPGPAVLLCINNGVRYGTERAAVGVMGNVTAFHILVWLSAIGLGTVLAASTKLFVVLKIIGALYLIYLGIRIWRMPLHQSVLSEPGHVQSTTSRNDIFKHAFLVTSSNPKAFVYVSALLPQFIDRTQAFLPQVLLLGVSIAMIQFLVFMMFVVLGSQSRSWFANARKLNFFNKCSGLTFIGFGIALGLSRNNV